MNRPRVLLADDHRLVAEALKGLLSEQFDLVGVTKDGFGLLEAARALQPDVIVADIAMPRLSGIDALVQLKRDDPQVRMIFLTMHREVAYARRALDAGALGFVLKHSAPEELILAVRAALQGQVFITPALAGEVLDPVQRAPQQSAGPVCSLTPRQRQILQLLAEGLSAKAIATALDISARTVEFHKYRMMASLGVRSSAELVRFAITHGVVS